MDKELLIKSLDYVIRSRKSIRVFSTGFPDEQVVKNIVQSAVYAPFGGATGLPFQEIRRIFVLSQKSGKLKEARELLLAEMKKNAARLNRLLFFLPFLRKKMQLFAARISVLSKSGIPALNDAPYYIIIAEKKGFPLVAKQSIAHALQNIWLTSTAAGLGFQLITATGMMSDNKQFCKLLGLPKGMYQLDGCVIGIPQDANSELKEFDVDKFVTWL
jgi:nitroreductase